MASTSDTLLVLIIGAVIVFALVAPSIMASGSDLLGGLMDFVNEGFGDTGLLAGSTSRVGMLVHYEDGTERLLDAKMSEMSILDPDSNKVVSWVEAQVFMTINKQGRVTSWSSTGLLRVRVYEAISSELVHQFPDQVWSDTGTDWEAGESRLMLAYRITADELDTLLLNAGIYQDQDEFELNAYTEITDLTMTFEDGKTESWSGREPYRTSWTFKWLISGISSVSLTVSFEPA